MLKAELHTHINFDMEDLGEVSHSAKELINRAAELNFQVLAITCHNLVFKDEEIKQYAQSKGILLIHGIERTIKGKHVLIYNVTNEQAKSIHTFEDLIKLKQKNKEVLVIAPHPFHHGGVCLGKRILTYFKLFDAWEYSWFYLNWLNPNKKTVNLARKYHKPLVGNSDVHNIAYLGRTYTLIDSKATIKAVCQAIKAGKTKVVTKPLSFWKFGGVIIKIIYWNIRRRLGLISQ